MLKKLSPRRVLCMMAGVFFIGVGVAFSRIALLGNDACTAFTLALSARLGITFGIGNILINCVYFAVELTLGRKKIGFGTLFNWITVGIFADLCTAPLQSLTGAGSGALFMALMMLTGAVILAFGAALYQTADVGIAPYDSLSLILEDRLHIPYFWCRMTTDCIAALLCFLLGGLLGPGTLFCAFCLGPFIAFFTRYAAEPLCGIRRTR